MNKFRFTIKILALAIFTFAFASMAQAQATRTWVSGVGDDANPCSRTAPCKTFAGAISKTATGGEIDALDPGGFGAVTLTKSVTIDGTGTLASIAASGTTGIIINGSNTSIIRIRGLSINGFNGTVTPGVDGIRSISMAALFVEDTIIDGFNQNGINISASTGDNELHIRNTQIRNIVQDGIRIVNTGSNATAMGIDHVNVSRAANGLNAGNGTRGHVAFSFFGENSNSGITSSQTTSTTDFVVSDSVIVGKGATVGSSIGINTTASTHVRIARVLITSNVNALGLGGTVDTGGNNTIMGNGTDQDPNGTLKIQK
jgi:hypothetical protein